MGVSRAMPRRKKFESQMSLESVHDDPPPPQHAYTGEDAGIHDYGVSMWLTALFSGGNKSRGREEDCTSSPGHTHTHKHFLPTLPPIAVAQRLS